MDYSHTVGPTCRLAPVVEPDPEDALLDGIPPISAQFFYHSIISIDDPLSTAPAPAPSSSDNKSSRAALRPFSRADNNALERAWLSLGSPSHRRSHQVFLANKDPNPELVAANSEKLQRIVQGLARKHKETHAREDLSKASLEHPADSLATTVTPVCCQDLLADASNMLRETYCEVTRRKQRGLDRETVIEQVMAAMERDRPTHIVVHPRAAASISTSSPRTDAFVLPGLSTSSRGRASSLISNPPASRSASIDSRPYRPPMSTPQTEKTLPKPANVSIRPPAIDDGISGKPFVRVGSDGTEPPPKSPAHLDKPACREDNEEIDRGRPAERPFTPLGSDTPESLTKQPSAVEIPVGISRLHMVSLPALQMKPTYWSPVNDISIVSRATWFYRDTMIPLEPAVANQLEAGYRELRPYSQTWKDEVRCAVEVGAEGEEKISFPLCPKSDTPASGNLEDRGTAEPSISSDPFCAAHCFRGEAAAEGILEPVSTGTTQVAEISRSYPSHHVIYKDGNMAFLLKPSLKPSAYYGRKPVSKIMKGLTIGTPVVRGFDRDIWDELHDRKKRMAPNTKQSHKTIFATDRHVNSPQAECPGCEAETDRERVTDLVLVAHGIGQKFAERVESFHFTHAVTAFRRAINIEVGSETVKPVLRDGFSGIMVLPVNWRHSLSLEDGGPMSDEDRANAGSEGFGLKDIEVGTLKAVRALISDVMFDIPFYMSQHKPKMIQALVGEANRVYRLWCRNNPGFAQNGRVHLIAHSLGSVMALEVLSKQPDIPPPLDLSNPAPETSYFEFNTINLFLLGSPAGFFLLLEHGSLIPRRGRQKPGAEASDIVAKDVVGETGVFGCLAVDNIYNILAKEDPIAYLLNGTIDPLFASSLRMANVPSATTSWFRSMGDAMRGFIPVGPAPTSDLAAPVLSKPPTFRLPSQLELEVHDFTREEIAERKAFLLNDNGQIDFYLRSGTGPLEIQYLNMLSAHTSYWVNRDLIRLLCVEIGRKPGRTNTLPVMRAVKMTRRDRSAK